MIDYKILIDGVDYTRSCSLPFKEQYCLDESLDNAVLNIKALPFRERIKPYTIVSIKKDDDVYGYYVANDNVTEIVGTNFFNHDLTLIEETKMLEKIIVDTNTITQPYLNDYIKAQRQIAIKYQPDGAWLGNLPEKTKSQSFINTLNEYKNFQLPSARELILLAGEEEIGFKTSSFSKMSIYIAEAEKVIGKDVDISASQDGIAYYADYVYETTSLDEKISFDKLGNFAFSITLSFMPGEVLLNVFLGNPNENFRSGNLRTNRPYFLKFTNYSQQQLIPKTNITEVVNRLLSICKTRRKIYGFGYEDLPKFTFNQEQAQEFSSIISPEFSFTKSTLRECLDQVAGYLHCITRLENGVVYFDKLGEQEEKELPKDYISYTESQDIEQYCSEIDTNVDNLINENEEQGSVVEPFLKGYETLRTEVVGARITDDTAIIETSHPIWKIKKVEMGFLKNGYFVGDITPFVFENAEYQTLSSTSGGFPYSKAFALYYTQGQKNIKGLNFKLPNPITPVFEKPAIMNIVEYVSGVTGLQDLFNVYGFVNLNFRITYVPIVNTRIKQHKTDYIDFENDITSIYNQSANVIESNAYGENLKGAVARLGNIEKFVTFKLPKVSNILNVGDIVEDDYYVSTISIENLNDYIKVTYGLSKDFNRLNKYIGIKNNLRMYEVSEKQSVDRFIIYEDYCIIGEDTNFVDSGILTYNNGIKSFINDFTQNETQNPISCVVARCMDKNNEGIGENSFVLPVVALSMGNSIVLTFKFEDNYSAGNQAENPTNYGDGDANYYKVQNYVPYGDYWGRVEAINLTFIDYPYDVKNWGEAIVIGDAIPEFTYAALEGKNYASTYQFNNVYNTTNGGYPIIIEKDNREAITMTYQLHFIKNKKSIVIGSGLAKHSNLISSNNSDRSLYIMPNKINKFAKTIDVENGTLAREYKYQPNTITQTNNKINLGYVTATANGKSWVIVDNATKELIFGENIDIKNGDTIKLPIMTFSHKIY